MNFCCVVLWSNRILTHAFCRDIFNAVKYVNDKYVGAATSTAARNSPIQLFPLMLKPNNIFINGKDEVVLGNFLMKLPDIYVRKNRKNVRQGMMDYSSKILPIPFCCQY